jgi:hypothetical protein
MNVIAICMMLPSAYAKGRTKAKRIELKTRWLLYAESVPAATLCVYRHGS